MNRKGEGPRKPHSQDNEPNFYALPFLPNPTVLSDATRAIAPSRVAESVAPPLAAVPALGDPHCGNVTQAASLAVPSLDVFRGLAVGQPNTLSLQMLTSPLAPIQTGTMLRSVASDVEQRVSSIPLEYVSEETRNALLRELNLHRQLVAIHNARASVAMNPIHMCTPTLSTTLANANSMMVPSAHFPAQESGHSAASASVGGAATANSSDLYRQLLQHQIELNQRALANESNDANSVLAAFLLRNQASRRSL
jgi:hypothetical protein